MIEIHDGIIFIFFRIGLVIRVIHTLYFKFYSIFLIVSDIDECAEEQENCHDNATCTNTPGSFSCDCRPGYEGDGIDNCTGTQIAVYIWLDMYHKTINLLDVVSSSLLTLDSNHSFCPHQILMNA